MTVTEAERIAEQVETMLMGVDIKPDTMTIEPHIIVSLQNAGKEVNQYIVSDLQGTHIVNGRSLKCPK